MKTSYKCPSEVQEQKLSVGTWESKVDLGVGSIKSTQVDLGLPSLVKSVCSSVTVEIFWRRRSHYKSFQVDLRSRLNQ